MSCGLYLLFDLASVGCFELCRQGDKGLASSFCTLYNHISDVMWDEQPNPAGSTGILLNREVYAGFTPGWQREMAKKKKKIRTWSKRVGQRMWQRFLRLSETLWRWKRSEHRRIKAWSQSGTAKFICLSSMVLDTWWHSNYWHSTVRIR